MFPNYKTITYEHSFLFWEWTTTKKIEDNWQDLGYIEILYSNDAEQTTICQKCRMRMRIGKEKNKTFKFCPRCLKKTTKSDTYNSLTYSP